MFKWTSELYSDKVRALILICDLSVFIDDSAESSLSVISVVSKLSIFWLICASPLATAEFISFIVCSLTSGTGIFSPFGDSLTYIGESIYLREYETFPLFELRA